MKPKLIDVIKIFIRLKLEEIWNFIIEALKFVGFIIGVFALPYIMFSSIGWLIYEININWYLGLTRDCGENDFFLVGTLVGLVGFMMIIIFVVIGAASVCLTSWLANNWIAAGREARYNKQKK